MFEAAIYHAESKHFHIVQRMFYRDLLCCLMYAGRNGWEIDWIGREKRPAAKFGKHF